MSLGEDIGRRPVEENFPYLVDQIRMLHEEANILRVEWCCFNFDAKNTLFTARWGGTKNRSGSAFWLFYGAQMALLIILNL